jgi:hypothetical membrane protein
MRLSNRQMAGLLLFVGTVQFAIFLTVAEEVYPGYSVSANYISDLGVGTAAAGIFNTSIVILGLTILGTSWFIFRGFKDMILMAVVALAGIGAIGVGIFTEAFGGIHSIVSLITFIFAGLSAILAFRVTKSPFRFLSVVLGIVSLVALGLFIAGQDAGLGVGGMERMIVWPVLTWAIGFGAYLLATGPSKEPMMTA